MNFNVSKAKLLYTSCCFFLMDSGCFPGFYGTLLDFSRVVPRLLCFGLRGEKWKVGKREEGLDSKCLFETLVFNCFFKVLDVTCLK